MILPTDKLIVDGREISVSRIEETGGGTTTDGRDIDTALYRDRAGNYYTGYLVQKSIEECLRIARRESFTFAADGPLYDSINEHRLTIQNVDERGAINWYIREFINEGPIKKLIRECAASFVPKSERARKFPVTAWVTRSTLNELQKLAELNSRTESGQLAKFALEGVVRWHEARRRRGRRGEMLPGQAPVQLQLVTALVAVTRAVTRTHETPEAHAAASEVLDALELVRETTAVA
jgi:hypothetical protein